MGLGSSGQSQTQWTAWGETTQGSPVAAEWRMASMDTGWKEREIQRSGRKVPRPGPGAKAWPRSTRGLVKMPKSQPRVRAFINFVGEKKKI